MARIFITGSADGLGLALKANASGIFDVVIHNAGLYQVSGQSVATLKNLPASIGSGSNRISYSDTKLHDLILSMAVARRWTDVYSNAVDPGWVPTRMGGADAPDSLEEGFETQVWLASGNDPGACVSGKYFHHKKLARFLTAAKDEAIQEDFLARCEKLTGVEFKS